jgi:hypothetical protein
VGIAAILTIIFSSHTYFPFRKPIKKGKGNAWPEVLPPLKPKHYIRVKMIAG